LIDTVLLQDNHKAHTLCLPWFYNAQS